MPIPVRKTLWIEELKRDSQGLDQHGTRWGYKPSVRIWEYTDIHQQDYNHVIAHDKFAAIRQIRDAMPGFIIVFRKG
jgi:hypothetical protein